MLIGFVHIRFAGLASITRDTLRASGTAVLVLGGAHDLSDNVPAGVKLIELTVKGYPGE